MTFPLDGYQLSDDAGDSWWFLDTRMTVKVSGEESGGAYTLIEFSAGHGFGSPRHIHQDEDEAFYVLDGEMRLVCGAKEWQASTGSLAFMPRASRCSSPAKPPCGRCRSRTRPGSRTSSVNWDDARIHPACRLPRRMTSLAWPKSVDATARSSSNRQ